MRRWLLMLVAFLLIPGAALAGGSGNIQLARPVEKLAVGKHPLYFQLLQHGHYPRMDAKVTIRAHSPNGTDIFTSAEIDPTYGDLYVYTGNLALDRQGVWQVTISTTESQIFFPPYEFQVDVLPAGTKLPDPGKVEPYRDTAAMSSAPGASPPVSSTPVSTAPAPASTALASSPPGRPAGWVWPVTGACAAAVALAGYLAWRRQG
ncbi:MAG: hypothetical protein JWN15_3357 [Firmicutes bacterium]|nr:hypothetical protein [Bacillota bacterium]